MSSEWTWGGKGAGKKIVVKFDKPLMGDASGRLPPLVVGERKAAPAPGVIYTASDSYSASYGPEKAFDGSTSTYWQTRAALPQWLQIDFGKAEAVTRFRYYSGGSYRVNEYKLEASNDLTTWTELWSGENAASTGWRDLSFTNETAYRYYRFVILSGRTSGRLYFYEAELYAGVGNEVAFTVTGMERDPIIFGSLTQREYTVESVERYPLPKYWQDDQSGDMDGVEAEAGGVRLERSAGLEWPDGILNLYSSFFTATVDETFILERVSSGSISNDKEFKIEFEIDLTGVDELSFSSSMSNRSYVSSAIWIDGVRTEISSSNYDKRVDSIDVSSIDKAVTVGFGCFTRNSSSVRGRVEFVEVWLDNKLVIPSATVYDAHGVYTLTLPTASIPEAAPRLRFAATTPDGTSITAEYACTGSDQVEPDTWTAVDDGDLLDLDDDTLWLRFTLETENDSVTPILEAVWLEEGAAPQDLLLLTMSPFHIFRDVEGSLTVAYDREKGNLTGTRPVESFTKSFLPADLLPTPEPVQENVVTGAISVEAEFIKLVPTDLGHKETVTAVISLDTSLIHVSVIPP